ncbi:ATP-Hypothetical protein cassette sub-family G (WHITE) member 2 [Nesidiocoris tenuis]|uniref:ABC transporter domain-containing protein n=1 Tax=Nesidiocoris tenuis TaxID=355587 RepID=A0ABN7BGB9_9HEMI|nr:ATP-Hypothetical protein cassette sub-family G (WHITE) member 2 [Nesidiocoris tenuis]
MNKIQASRATLSSAVEPEDQVTYAWKSVNVTAYSKGRFIHRFLSRKNAVLNTKKIIDDVTGIARPGEMLALMGASGAGKSTLLNTLTYRVSRTLDVSGDLLINGLPFDSTLMSFLAAYVQQEDIFLGNLTVMEHLEFAAKVVMARGTKKALRKERIHSLIEELNLSKCQNTRIGIPGKKKGISGGEMKRLAFATGLLNNPPLMFCDEPTSGLDSFMSKNVVLLLKRLALQGRTIITTIHQPSSEVYFLFDKVMFLAEGRVAFIGSPADANVFFASIGAVCPANFNPADFLVSRLATQYEDLTPGAIPQSQFLSNVYERYQSSRYAKNVLDDIHESREAMVKKLRLSMTMNKFKNLHYAQPWRVQFSALLVRSFWDIIKSRELVTWKFLQTILVALVFGALYWNQGNDQDSVLNINGAIFISVMNLCLNNVFSVIHVFIEELPVFLREHYNGMYRVDAYFLSKTLVELPVHIILPIVYVSVMYYMVNLNPSYERFLWHALVQVTVANIGTSFGYFIGIITNDLSLALNCATPMIIPLILFSGFLLNIDTLWKYLSWVRYMSWFYYAMEALLVVQWDGNEYINCTRPQTTCPSNGTVVLGMFSYKTENFQFDLYMMGLMVILLRLFALSALQLRVMKKN